MNDQRPHNPRRVLIIEDDDRVIDVFVDYLLPLGVEVAVAKSRADAEAAVAGDYRIAVCDLQIPSVDGRLDADALHGLAVLAQIRGSRPDVPVIVFSGLGLSGLSDWGDVSQLQVLNKSQLPECLDMIKAAVGV